MKSERKPETKRCRAEIEIGSCSRGDWMVYRCTEHAGHYEEESGVLTHTAMTKRYGRVWWVGR